MAAGQDLADQQVELKKDDRIIFFGDSLTALAGQERPQEHVSKGYVRIVRETLQKNHPDKNIEVDWVATGGHTVPDLLKRVEKDVLCATSNMKFLFLAGLFILNRHYFHVGWAEFYSRRQ
jgi:hypothetical protein